MKMESKKRLIDAEDLLQTPAAQFDMTAKELAAMITGREYGDEIAQEEINQAAEAGLVVVYGYSDDNVELRGAIYCTLPPRSELFTHGRIREYANELIRLQSGETVYGYGMQLCLDPENRPYSQDNFLCRKIIGEFVCDGIECFTTDYRMNRQQTERIAKESCMDMIELAEYEYDSICLYGWHISELKIYGKPLELSEFWLPPETYCEKGLCGGCPYDCVPSESGDVMNDCEWKRPLKRPPRSWCYVGGKTER